MRKNRAAVMGVAANIIVILVTVPQLRFAIWGCLSSQPICIECGYHHVVHDYFESSGISRDTLWASPSEVVEMYGEPNFIEVEVVDSETVRDIYHYDGFGIIFDFRNSDTEPAEDCTAQGFILLSPDIKLRWDVHVGSTREEIIHAYRKCPSINYPEANGDKMGDWVYDTGKPVVWINILYFTYDENDRVTSIRYFLIG